MLVKKEYEEMVGALIQHINETPDEFKEAAIREHTEIFREATEKNRAFRFSQRIENILKRAVSRGLFPAREAVWILEEARDQIRMKYTLDDAEQIRLQKERALPFAIHRDYLRTA